MQPRRPIKPKTCKFLSKPWRDIPKLDEYSQSKQDNLEFLKSYRPLHNEATHLRILLYGPVGAGKSSFINSVDNVLQGRDTGRALADAASGSSFTRKYKTYKFHKDGGHYSFVLSDIMGFEKGADQGITVEDVKLILKGHVKDNYEFVPGRSLTESDPGYKSSPTLDDRVHVLVSVVPADSLSQLNDEVVRKMREVRLAASSMGIPQLAIVTKIDQVSLKKHKHLRKAYMSKKLKSLAETFSEKLGLPMKCIFLVKNYETALKMNLEADVLILWALRQMINYGKDYLNDH